MSVYHRVPLQDSDRREWKTSYSIFSWYSKSFWAYFGMAMAITAVISLGAPFAWPKANNSEQFVMRALTFFGTTLIFSFIITLLVTLRHAIDLRFGFKRIGRLDVRKTIDLNEYKLLILSNRELILVKKLDGRLGGVEVGSSLQIERTATYKLVKRRLRISKPAHNNV